MNDITMMPNDYIVTYTKTDTIRERYSNGDVMYVVKEERVPLILCGECKYWDGFECQCEWASTDHEGGASYSLYRDADDFCSYGERID